jgi:hypothetical protein
MYNYKIMTTVEKFTQYQNMHPITHPPKKKNDDPCNCRSKCVPQLPQSLIENCKLVVSRVYLLDKLPKNSIVAEVGIGYGTFSQAIYEICTPKKLHLIDTVNPKKDALNKLLENENVTFHLGYSFDELGKLPDNYLDWVYIDASHDYQDVSRDIEIARKKVKHDGLIVCNDYIYYSHVEKLDYGVVDAVNEFCIKHNYEMIFLALNCRMYCDVVLKKVN